MSLDLKWGVQIVTPGDRFLSHWRPRNYKNQTLAGLFTDSTKVVRRSDIGGGLSYLEAYEEHFLHHSARSVKWAINPECTVHRSHFSFTFV